jgi:hypothetical protein
MIPYGRQDINQADVDALIAVLQSDFLAQIPSVRRCTLPRLRGKARNHFLPLVFGLGMRVKL